MNKKVGIGLCSLLAITTITTGCGKEAKLYDNTTAVSLKGAKITATDYYNEIKTSNISKLVDIIDHQLFDEKYPSNDEEDKSVKEQINQIKETYGSNETMYLSAIQQYFGVSSEDELEEMLRLEYKRNEAVEDYIKDALSDKEIENYYNENIIGDIKASHILIKPDVDSDATDEEKQKAENKAKKEAEKIIKKLKDGEDFAKLAKEYSDDTSTAKDGGNLGYFNTDDMDENFMDAVKKLNNNEYTKEPVKTQYGYHIILKVDQKDKPKLKEVKGDIKTTLANAKLDGNSTLHYQTLIDIREKNNIKWQDDKLEKQYNELMDQLLESASSSTTN
ncbi:MAG: peptidylprolyl isomerase [Candidatus Faecimonas sp.]|nr:peptidylprolyl isomerase [Mycoplasmatota bacterium]MDY2908761.1 peptidylprolyl isomerase [Candidatus Faecimonas sp.]